MRRSFAIICVAFASTWTALFAIKDCGVDCRYRLCPGLPGREPVPVAGRVLLRAPNVAPNGPLVCFRDVEDTFGFVRKTGEPMLQFKSGPDVEMSKWAPPGLKKSFPKKFFFVKKKPVFGKSTLSFRTFSANQDDFLSDLCVKLPIRSYEQLDKKTRKVKKIINTKGKPEDCVAFRTRKPDLVFELLWEGQDDLDLSVADPTGRRIDKFNPNPRRSCGRLISDNNTSCLSRQKAVSEVIRFIQPCSDLKGKYKVVLRHFNNCDIGPTKWSLRVTSNLKQVFFASGQSNKDLSRIFYEKTIEIM